jgi:peptidoglycan/xylan/chitin deacetylase (PgdA/CDA1 family)
MKMRPVVAGVRLVGVLIAVFVGLVYGSGRAQPAGDGLGPAGMRSYSQTFRVTFKTEEAARLAELRIVPLYHDFRAGFSSRWDDSTVNDVRAAEVMAKYGQYGTFYLNSLSGWYQDSKATGIAVSDPGMEIPRILLQDGDSIGGHTLTHPVLPALSSNAAFKEIMGVRVELESRTASPVMAFVYPFVSFQSPLRQGGDRTDYEEMLHRAGYYLLGENNYDAGRGDGRKSSGFLDTRFIMADGRSSDLVLNQFLSQPQGVDDRPLFLVTMHAWVSNWGGPEFPLLGATYQKWAGRKDLWYTTQNHYAAYRYQDVYSRLNVHVKGKVLSAELLRPDPVDLNDWTPLTFKVEGAGKDDVVSVDSATADLKPVALGESYGFDLFHDRDRRMTQIYAERDNPTNSDQLESAEGGGGSLRALLFRRDQVLSLALQNNGTERITDVRVAFRLPLRWREGVVTRAVERLEPGETVTLRVPLTERADTAHYVDGPEYDVAQVDYRGQLRGRLYLTCEVPGGEPAASFARNGFLVLGPLPGDVAGFDPLAAGREILGGSSVEKSYTLPTGETLQWKAVDAARGVILDPDIIPTTGKPNLPSTYPGDKEIYSPHFKLAYLLYGSIVAEEAQTVQAVVCKECVRQVWLNGKTESVDRLALNKGLNDLRILYVPSMATGQEYSERNYGCYFRLTDVNGKRVENMVFQRPRMP